MRIETQRISFFFSRPNNKICSLCTQFPLCRLSYKELAIIRLLQIKKSEGINNFSPSQLHSEFLKFYRIEKDGYEKFKSIVDSIVGETGLIVKKTTTKNGTLKIINSRKTDRLDYSYSLNPSIFLDSIDLNTISLLCPIGYEALSYQILEILNQNDLLTVEEIIQFLVDEKNIKKKKKTIRRRLKGLLATGIIFANRPNDVRKPIKYSINNSCFLSFKFV